MCRIKTLVACGKRSLSHRLAIGIRIALHHSVAPDLKLTASVALFLGLLVSPDALLAAAHRRRPCARRGTCGPVYQVSKVNDSANHPDVKPKSAGDAVVRAQILLDRAHFSPGQIDGRWGDNLGVAVLGYQAAHHLPPTGRVDQVTWQALNTDTETPLAPYTISAGDVEGPFERIPNDLMAQAKLKHLDYQSPAEELGERFHIDPALLAKLNPRRSLGRAGQRIFVPNVSREYAPQADRVAVSKSHRTVAALAADGSVLAQYPATIGSEHDPLPIGDWKVIDIQHNPVFNFNPDFFWDAKPQDAKTRIAAGPRNPVGVVWIGLSKEHYGIHGTPKPGLIGHTESHGCIRLTNWDAEELSKMLKRGVPVALQEE